MGSEADPLAKVIDLGFQVTHASLNPLLHLLDVVFLAGELIPALLEAFKLARRLLPRLEVLHKGLLEGS